MNSIELGLKTKEPIIFCETMPLGIPSTRCLNVGEFNNVLQSVDRTLCVLDANYHLPKNSPACLVIKSKLDEWKAKGISLILQGDWSSLTSDMKALGYQVEFTPPDDAMLSEVLSGYGLDVVAYLPNVRGMSLIQLERAIAELHVSGKKSPQEMWTKRWEYLRQDNLPLYPVARPSGSLGGMSKLKEYLSVRKNSILNPTKAKSFGLPAPKGITLAGVPGCGKSYAAKLMSGILDIPVINFKLSECYGSLLGETEKSMTKSFKIVEQMSPCVLFIDELEKAFGGRGDLDGGTSSRILGLFLTWLQDKPEGIYVVATANDVMKLPPEFLRKGRFDEVFFVDLPNESEREEIFNVILKKFGKSVPVNLSLLEATDGFTGSEIEELIIEAMQVAFNEDREMTIADIVSVVGQIKPLSVSQKSRIDQIRAWGAMNARKVV